MRVLTQNVLGPADHGWEARSCERVLVEPVGGVQASDHYGVLADLMVPERAPGSPGRPVSLRPAARRAAGSR